ncbi:MAG TPA: MraY family glycosyltransferase [Candidatus Babeliales bacterium]|nr:MraY family glycosyltransferase [Candidatus Babeliales bacterium]
MKAVLITAFFSFAISFLFTFYLVPMMIALANQFGFIDIPDGKIKNHERPTPYLGGIAIYLGFLASFILTYPFDDRISMFLAGTTLLLFVGLLDDFIVLRPYQKFVGQSLAAFCFIKAGLHLKEHFFYHFWNIPLSFIWMVSVINAFNLVDVMDGLATLLAIGSALSFLVLAFYFSIYSVVILLTSLLGALCAFFWYNQPKAQIFMGDAGALFIGGFFAVIPFLFNWGTYNWYGYLIPIIILAIPLLEIGTLILIRSYKRIPFYQANPDHFSIYLIKNGWSKWSILRYVLCISLVCGYTGFLFVINTISFIGLATFATLLGCIWFFLLIPKKEAK